MAEETTNEMTDFELLIAIRNATEKDLSLIALYAAASNPWVVKDAIMALRKKVTPVEPIPEVHPDAVTPIPAIPQAEWYRVRDNLLDGKTVMDAAQNKVKAIKHLRERVPMSLKEAKDYVESVLEDLNNGEGRL